MNGMPVQDSERGSSAPPTSLPPLSSVASAVTTLPKGGSSKLARANSEAAKPAEATAPAAGNSIALAKFLPLVAQLILIVLIVQYFKIESRAFSRLFQMAAAGFVIQYFLPGRFRLAFFVCLSLGAIVMVMAPTAGGWEMWLDGLGQAGWLVGLGIGLIGVCHLPLRHETRVGILVAIAVALGLARAGFIPVPWSGAVWPILGAMFMFRLMIYLYDLKHNAAPTSFLTALAYFFMLPNVCFPLFPVIDYKTFARSRSGADRHQTYQVGIHWILRGITHLLLYRLVYHELTLSENRVATLGDVLQYVVTTFLLYLRISGQFHLIIGMMRLFGFELPETNHLYYLSSSFTDFWRRINIYWKDFMMKLFYYPVFFKLRKRGETQALVLSTVGVFVVTWFLHGYQSFWIHGSFMFSWNDALFWAILGSLVIVTSLREAKRGRKRTLGARTWTAREYAGLVARTVGTFALLCFIWSLWTAGSIRSWLLLWQAAGFVTADDWWLVPVGLVALALFAAATILSARQDAARARGAVPTFARQTSLTTAWAIALVVLALPNVSGGLGSTGQRVLANLRSTELNKADVMRMDRGYYEKLLAVDRNSPLWNAYNQRPVDWIEFTDTGALRDAKGFAGIELTPNFELAAYGKVLRTNHHGLRNRPVELTKEPGTYRIAVLGSSYTMGFGVSDDETFVVETEGRLNALGAETGKRRFELINFGIYGYSPIQNLYVFETKVLEFRPDAVLYVSKIHDNERPARHLAQRLNANDAIPWPELAQMARDAGVEPGTDVEVGERRLLRLKSKLAEFAYRRIAERCRADGILPLWAFMPRTQVPDENDEALAAIARQAGFEVMTLAGVYEGQALKSIIVAEWDGHPNAQGHRLLAERLTKELKTLDASRGLGLFSPTPSGGAK